MSKLDEAFQIVDRVHGMLDREEAPDGCNYLILEALGSGKWAASFDAGLGDEWYEPYCIKDFCTATVGLSPEDVIKEAAEKFFELLGTKL